MTDQALVLSIQAAGEQLERERTRARRPKQQSMFADDGGLFGAKPKPKSKALVFADRNEARIHAARLGHNPAFQGGTVECYQCSHSGRIETAPGGFAASGSVFAERCGT
jgi:hypothetical protein